MTTNEPTSNRKRYTATLHIDRKALADHPQDDVEAALLVQCRFAAETEGVVLDEMTATLDVSELTSGDRFVQLSVWSVEQ